MARYKTIKDAAHAWVEGFSHIPRGICEKLLESNCDELVEVTPPAAGERVFIYDGEFGSCEGVIIGRKEGPAYSGETMYSIQLDDDRECVVEKGSFEVCRDDILPMWGTLWAFSGQLDNDWLADYGGLQLMADCGFRIYEQEDYQYIFGIDGAGYDFYHDHWIPLYKARGLQWHESDKEDA